MIRYNISFAGAGRVAGALCRELYTAGHKIGFIVSESEKNGVQVADSCNALWSSDLIFDDSNDIIIVAVPDIKLAGVLDKIRCRPETLVVHTAGSTGLEAFPEKIKQKGIFYPLQTFSKERKVVFKDLPFFLESSDNQSSVILENLTKSIGGKVYFADTEHRRLLHLAAVFTCNFSNHMLTTGKEVALKAGFPFEVLLPLIKETFSKAMDIGPENSQTGPAVRNDLNTIEKHLELLSFSPELHRLYSEITRSIIKYYKKQ
jgi:predicted short-subunit dehydrogenase-like oxidoreductase (DUF2520 family)